jgi:adenylate cyclase
VIISYHLVEALPAGYTSPWTITPIGPVELKGKQEPHLIYEVEVQIP